jgi:putative FmdB family regulatory protein
MPTYEYVCTDCSNAWEEIQKISAAPIEVCPKCSHKTAKRQISGGNFILKGGGWYADLYSSSSNKKSEGAKSETSTSSESTSTPKKAESTAPAAPAATTPSTTPSKT